MPRHSDKTVRVPVSETKQWGPQNGTLFKQIADSERKDLARRAMSTANLKGGNHWRVSETNLNGRNDSNSFLYVGTENGKRVYKRSYRNPRTGEVTREKISYQRYKDAVRRIERGTGGYLMHTQG